MIENLNYSDIGKWVKFPDGEGGYKIGRIKMYDNSTRRVWVIIMPFTKIENGNDWKDSKTTVIGRDDISYYEEPISGVKEEDHGESV